MRQHTRQRDELASSEEPTDLRHTARRWAAVGVFALAATVVGLVEGRGSVTACSFQGPASLCTASALLVHKESHNPVDEIVETIVATVIPVPTDTPVPPPPPTDTPIPPPPPTDTPVPPPPPTSTPVPPPPPTSTPLPPAATSVPPIATGVPTGTSATATGVPSGTPSPTGTVTTTTTPSTTPSTTPAGTGTPSPAATATATVPPVIAIGPARRVGGADPGANVRYAHTVTNGSPDEATVDLRVTSSQGWRVRLLDGNGESALRDTDDDGLVDVGELEPGARARITVVLTVPEFVAGGTLEVTTVTASMAGTSKTASAKDRTTVNGKLILTLATAVGTADVPPSGPDETASLEGGPAVITGTSGGAVTVRVTSTGPWSGGCSAPTGATAGDEGSEGPLAWRVRGSGDGWTTFTDGADPTCFSSQEPGNLTYTYEYAADDPADEDDTPVVTYRVTGDGG